MDYELEQKEMLNIKCRSYVLCLYMTAMNRSGCLQVFNLAYFCFVRNIANLHGFIMYQENLASEIGPV